MRTRLILMSIVIVGALVSLLRVPAPHLDTVWAEDGELFLQEALGEGSLSVIFTGYAGYQHLVPRLVTALVLLAPIDLYGLLVFVVCAIIVGLVAAAVFWLSRDLVPWMPARLALAGITILLPLAAQEVLGNMADLHSYGMWLAPWLALYRPRSWRGGVGWGVVALLVAMTEIQTILFLPLLLLNWRREHRYAWPIAAGLIIGGLAQVITTITTPRPSTAQWLGVRSIVEGYLYNTVAPMANPDPYWLADVFVATGVLLPALVLVPFVVAGAVAFVGGTGRQRLLVVTLAFASAAIYAGGAIADGSFTFAYSQMDHSQGFLGIVNSRYGVASGMMLAAVVPVCAAVVHTRWPHRAGRVISWALVVVLTAQFALASTQSESARTSGVTWSGGVAEWRTVCRTDPPADGIAPIPIAPQRTAKVSCDYLG